MNNLQGYFRTVEKRFFKDLTIFTIGRWFFEQAEFGEKEVISEQFEKI